MDPISIAMGIATLVPNVLKWLGHDNAAESAEKIVGIAQKVTGTSDGDDALEMLKTNPTMALQMQQEIDRHSEELEKIKQAPELAMIAATQQSTSDVNKTMQVEAAAEHWPTYGWRPAIGFAVAFDIAASSLLVIGVFVAQCCGMSGADKAISNLPATLGSLAALVGLAMPILGIASYYRGKMQADPSIPTINRG